MGAGEGPTEATQELMYLISVILRGFKLITMSKLIQFRLDDHTYGMLVSCLTQEKIKANEQIEKYGSVVNPFRNMSENQFAQQVLINTIAKRYIELHQGLSDSEKM